MPTPAKTGSILAAALALPGIVPSAHAQVTVPNATLIQFKYLYYRDYQENNGVTPGSSGDRMTVNSPALYLLAPISDSWVFEIGAVYDSMTGASPYYHTVLSGASGEGVEDKRLAGDITVTKYFGRTAVVGARCLLDRRRLQVDRWRIDAAPRDAGSEHHVHGRHRLLIRRSFSARRTGFHAQQKYA